MRTCALAWLYSWRHCRGMCNQVWLGALNSCSWLVLSNHSKLRSSSVSSCGFRGVGGGWVLGVQCSLLYCWLLGCTVRGSNTMPKSLMCPCTVACPPRRAVCMCDMCRLAVMALAGPRSARRMACRVRRVVEWLEVFEEIAVGGPCCALLDGCAAGAGPVEGPAVAL